MVRNQTTSPISTEYLETLFELMARHDVEHLRMGELSVVRSVADAPVSLERLIDNTHEEDDEDPLASPPTSPEQLDRALANLGRI